jgi:Leucine-rich repeat (LRR) protein
VLPIIAVLHQLPAIQTIDLKDNRLTDTSLLPLSRELLKMTSLMHLDLSYNKVYVEFSLFPADIVYFCAISCSI